MRVRDKCNEERSDFISFSFLSFSFALHIEFILIISDQENIFVQFFRNFFVCSDDSNKSLGKEINVENSARLSVSHARMIFALDKQF